MNLRHVADAATTLVAGAALLLVTYHISGQDTSEARVKELEVQVAALTAAVAHHSPDFDLDAAIESDHFMQTLKGELRYLPPDVAAPAPPSTTTTTTPTTTTAPWDTTTSIPLDRALGAGRELLTGVDVSVWTGPISSDQWATAFARGARVAVVGAWTGREANVHCERQMSGARTAGLHVAAYTVLNALPGAESVAKAAAACGDEWQHANFVALDIEVDGVDQEIFDSAANAVIADGLRPVTYTGRWFWAEAAHLGNPNWGSDRGIPLWHSAYSGDHSDTFGKGGPYGGWTAASLMGHQYEGTNTEDGFSDDRSVFDRAFIAAG